MSNDLEIQKLTPSEVTRIFSGMSPLKATRYYNKIMTNPNSPQANIDMVRQYRLQNEERFLSDEQMKNQRNKGSWSFGKGFSGGYRQGGRVYDGDGFSYDNYGNRYDAYGNNTAGYQDGGSGYRFQGNGRANGFSNYYGAANQRPRNQGRFNRKPVGEVRSMPEISATICGLEDNVSRTRYFNKVVQNPMSNKETVTNLVKFRNSNPFLFATDEEVANAPKKKRRPGPWGNVWKSEEEMQAMTPKERKFFVGSVYRNNRVRNLRYAVKVFSNPTTSAEDKQAMSNVVNRDPYLFFNTNRQNRRQE